ncbi:MAG: glycosyltransferase [Butyrivibrio sp.]|nr:glycosyltransferase [Butyrivibrio sp.]
MVENEKTNGLVSIIVPVYNAASFIEETIKMVCRQTYTDWELILVNDASTDNSTEVIRNVLKNGFSEKEQKDNSLMTSEVLNSKIILIDKPVNEGAAMARNTGIEKAQGRYIAFLDADDVWLPHKLEKELSFMEEKDAGFVFCAYEFGDTQAKPTGKVVHVPETLDYKRALSRTVIFTTTVVFDTNKLKKEDIKMPNVPSEDTATWWTILKRGEIAYGLDEVLAIYRRPEKSLSSNKFKAIKRIWFLYRNIAGLGVIPSAFYFAGWAFRAVERRI